MSTPKEVGGLKLGALIIEGKTKQVFELLTEPNHCLLINKDRITAGDGVKAAISNETIRKVFEILQTAGVKTSYVRNLTDTSFISKKCHMVPIEWVARRFASGSFLKRYPGVPEGFRFRLLKQETFFKNNANHDRQWCEEQIICSKFNFGGFKVGQDEVDIMRKTTILVFEILEKAWKTRNCALIDIKIEFGLDSTTGEILVADVIDSDSWRLWPSGDKRLMVDKNKKVYRNLATVTGSDLDVAKRNFKWIGEQLEGIIPKNDHLVVILMEISSNKEHCEKIGKYCNDFGLKYVLRFTSAHKGPKETLQIMSEYERVINNLVFIAVAGRSNGLDAVLSGNTLFPVINCPPVKPVSLNLPSGCINVMYPEAAALMAAQILGLLNYIIWSKFRVRRLNDFVTLKKDNKSLRRA